MKPLSELPVIAEVLCGSDSLDEERLGKVLVHCLMNGYECARVGSSTILGVRHPEDFDLLVLVESIKNSEKTFSGMGFTPGGSQLPESQFLSMKDKDYGGINLILVEDKDYYSKYVEANDIAVEHNLTNKQERIAVFDFVLDRKKKLSALDFSLLPLGEKKKFSKAVSDLYYGR